MAPLTTLPGTTQLIVRASWNPRMVYFVDCPECGRQNVEARHATVCPNCGKKGFAPKFVEDKFKGDLRGVRQRHECNDKCMASVGPNCECRCEGLNHGRGA